MKKRIVTLLLLQMALPFALSGCNTDNNAPEATSTPAVKGLWTPSAAVNKIVVLSDIHLGVDDRYSETVENRDLLLDFLAKLKNTSDVREVVLNGDFLDDWYLPLTYATYSDPGKFYREVIKNNQEVIDALNSLMKKGIKLVYIPGNHDMLLKSAVLDEALPGMVQQRDAEGLGVYITGDRQEISIEHGHRYDVFSAPDSISNQEFCQNGESSILPPGYFYARVAASWVLQGKPPIKKDYPEITTSPDPIDNPDQYGAYLYYKVLSSEFTRITPIERFEDKVVDLNIACLHGRYSIQDFYPVQQPDGTISAPLLFKNFQRTWDERQAINQVAVKTSFVQAVAGTLSPDYYFNQAKVQYLENPEKSIDIVVFGHTHSPEIRTLERKQYVNDGTWVDHNSVYPYTTRTFTVITTGTVSNAALYDYMPDGTIIDISNKVSK